ncbi:hypothetical protein ACFYNY_23415 [Streptomyces sp. NPDC006530]|uniref:hypothetical protein n=1 Tax=Streptomyces sp. NPDC006530 TaxID=3364750 RepID=UPI0036AAF3FB
MNYLEALHGDDGYFNLGGTWLPAWVRQTAEQTKRAAFRHIRSGGGQAGYVAARTMLTEVSYGTERALVEQYARRGAARMDVYGPVPSLCGERGPAAHLTPHRHDEHPPAKPPPNLSVSAGHLG